MECLIKQEWNTYLVVFAHATRCRRYGLNKTINGRYYILHA